MKKSLTSLTLLLAVAAAPIFAQGAAPAAAPAAAKPAPRVVIETTKGKIVVELYPDKAPRTVENFLQYAKSGQFTGTIFHRVIPNFMIQGGGFTAGMVEKPTKAPIQNEADNRLTNDRGTIAMARTGDPNSATAQWFINLRDNTPLNFTAKTQGGWGYAVFGKVVEGMDVVDQIATVQTTSKGMYQNVPVEPIVIQKATVLAAATK